MTPPPAVQPQQRRRSTRQASASAAASISLESEKERKKVNKRSKKVISDSTCTCQQSGNGHLHVSHESDATNLRRHRGAIEVAEGGMAGNRVDVSSSSRSRKGKGRELSSTSYQIADSSSYGSGTGIDFDNARISPSISTTRNGTRSTDRGRKRLLSSRESSPPPPIVSHSYLASASSLPWAIGANDDAPNALAFSFARNGNIDGTEESQGSSTAAYNDNGSNEHRNTRDSSTYGLNNTALTPPKEEAALALAPFLFDTSDGDELHPVGSIIRRSSSLPARVSSVAGSNIHPPQSHLDDWLESTAFCASPAALPVEESSSTSSSTSHSRSTTSSSSNGINAGKAGTSPPTSPTSSNEQSSSSSPKASTLFTIPQSTLEGSHKRSSSAMILDTVRLKKRKLSHRIRSFLLLRPPGLPYPGTDGAADILHITRAPAWLKNATSELSRESRMAPTEHYWSGFEANSDNWCITPLEKEFGRLLKINKERDALEADEREALSDDYSMALESDGEHRSSNTGVGVKQSALNNNFDKTIQSGQDSLHTSSILPNSKRKGRKRLRQVSAPPAMEADPSKTANDLLSPPMPDRSLKDTHTTESTSNVSSTPPIPPEVLKAQLLAVLRSRLPEGAKNSDAPLRMKKFVVWNGEFVHPYELLGSIKTAWTDSFVCTLFTAWIRRSTIPSNRPRYRRRSTSAERSDSAKAEDRRNRKDVQAAVSISSPPVQVIIPEIAEETNDMIIDTSLSHTVGQQEEEGHFDPYGMTTIPDEDHDDYTLLPPAPDARDACDAQDSSMSSSALGLMLHDETSSTARRFSRAFGDDNDADNTQEEDHEDDFSNTGMNVSGPYIGSKSRLLHSTDHNHADVASSQELTLPLVLNPSPIHPTNPSQYSQAINSYPCTNADGEGGEYASMSPPPSHQEERTYHRSLHEHEKDRAMSPLRVRMEQKSSTATPPSFSANLHHVDDQGMDSRIEEADIVPFWFDQESVTFDSSDNEDDQDIEDDDARKMSIATSMPHAASTSTSRKSYIQQHHSDAFDTPAESSLSRSPTERKEIASFNASRATRSMGDTWNTRSGRGVAT